MLDKWGGGFLLTIIVSAYIMLYWSSGFIPAVLGIVVPLVLTFSLKRWRWGFVVLVCWFVFVDMLRKMIGGSPLLLMASDSLMLYTCFAFFLWCHLRAEVSSVKYIPRPVWVLIFCIVCIVLIQAANPAIPYLVLAVAGVRTYLLYIPALILGVFLFRREADIKKTFLFLFILSAIVIGISFVEVILGPERLGVAFSSMGHPVHSFGNYLIELVPATFASSKRYGRFLFLMYPFLYGFACMCRGKKILRIGLFILFFVAAVISGSKEIVVIIILYHFYFLVVRIDSNIKKYALLMGIASVVIVAWFTILNFDNSEINESNYRILGILSNQDDWMYRLKIYTYGALDDVKNVYSSQELMRGSGVGTYGQETRLIGESEYVRTLGLSRDAGDAGLTKLLVELGVWGAIFYLCCYLSLLFVLWRYSQSIGNKRMREIALSILFIPIGWLILYFKAHTLLSDGMVSFGLWFSCGVIIALYYNDKCKQFPVVDCRLKCEF